ncbi:hypothetical protein T02_6595 [Trichinella nativa]|uniref:Transmembrane protein n=1 Tax=Trichinella nativa TaxID=6335 RepID=A0A0V1KZC6_9BILA|nr:hypothetical protein T02_6595 [Trichinella nativa]
MEQSFFNYKEKSPSQIFFSLFPLILNTTNLQRNTFGEKKISELTLEQCVEICLIVFTFPNFNCYIAKLQKCENKDRHEGAACCCNRCLYCCWSRGCAVIIIIIISLIIIGVELLMTNSDVFDEGKVISDMLSNEQQQKKRNSYRRNAQQIQLKLKK